MITFIPRHFSTSPSPNYRTFVSWDGGFRLFVRRRSIFRLAAVVICVALVTGSHRSVAQSTTPDSHSADTQSDKPREGGQPPAVGGVNTGGAHAAVLDKEHRPITAGGFVKDGPVLFEDIARQAGLTKWKHVMGTPEKKFIIEANGSGVGLIDTNNDGWLDIYLVNGSTYDAEAGKATPPKAALFHNNHDGTFTNVAEKAGVTNDRWGVGVAIADYDNDGWPDIYVAVDSEPSILFHNNKDGTFTDVSVMAGCAYNEDGQEQAGMGVGVGDYDCDGWLDIFKTNFTDDTPDLYHNNGDGTFTDVTFVAGLGVNTQYVCWGAGFMDYDNDGWTDIFHVTGHVYPEIETYHLDATFKSPRIVYRNLGNGKFKDVSAQMGPGVAERFSSRGCAFGDYDNDGDLDVLVLNMNDRFSLLRNEGGNKNNWIKLKLIGTHCNRTAVGARARVVTGKHAQIDEVHCGTSVMSQSDLRLHFGLGDAKEIDSIEIRWPTTQKTEKFTKIEANQILTIKEGSGIIKAERLEKPGKLARLK